MLNPCPNPKYAPSFKLGATSAAYVSACNSSGIRIITISAFFTASAVSLTVNPASSACPHDFEPFLSPTVTSIPLSFKFNA